MSGNPNSSDFFQTGAVFGDQYQLIELAGKGAFGEVWKARDIVGCRDVTLKFLGSDIQDNFFTLLEEGLGTFKIFKEALSLNHQYICPIYGLKRDGIGPYLIMKWLDGESLRNRQDQYLRQKKLIPQDEAYKILLEIAEALDYAHSRGIVHCDVKPENIFIERFKETESAILLDFGLADVFQETRIRYSRNESQSTTSNSIGKARLYMAPEQLIGHSLNGQTDQYALAIVAYELLSGKRPFNVAIDDLRFAVLNAMPEKIEGVSSAINSALQRALSKKKEDRFASCREFVQSLEPKHPTGYPEKGEAADKVSTGNVLTIPEGVEQIEDSCFYHNDGRRIRISADFTEVIIPGTVTEIGYGAFKDCSSLTEIEIPNSVTEIGDGAFENCASLTEIEIPNSVTEIGDGAFENCASLTKIEIPNSVTRIGDGAFKNCSSLTEIEIPSSVTEVGFFPFEGCTSLKTVYASQYFDITDLDLPDSVRIIRF